MKHYPKNVDKTLTRADIFCITARMQTVNILRDRRLKLDLTQKQFGDRIGVDAMTVSRWERGDSLPRRRFWAKISSELDVAIEDIIRALPSREDAQ